MGTSVMHISPNGLALIKAFEAFVPYPYDDLVVRNGRYPEWTGGPLRGTLTIGYGHTNLSNFPPIIVPGMRMSEPEAAQLLRNVLMVVYEPIVRRNVGSVVLSQQQFDALVSWVYNTGGPAKSAVWRAVRAGRHADVPALLARWNKSKGQVLRGLVRRRSAEGEMYLGRVERALQIAGAAPDRSAKVTERPRPPATEIAKRTAPQTSTGTAVVVGGGAAVANETAKPDGSGLLVTLVVVAAFVAVVALAYSARNRIRELVEDWS